MPYIRYRQRQQVRLDHARLGCRVEDEERKEREEEEEITELESEDVNGRR